MAIGLIGRKCGMTRVFTESGQSIPVTVVEIEPNRVTQLKTLNSDGYEAIQITTGSKKASRVTKPLAGHYAKAKVELGRGLWEFRIESEQEKENFSKLNLGDTLTVELFQAGQLIDVTGVSKGKGFQGVIKRHNFRGQDRSHGNSLSHRVHGSVGQNQTPGRVFKGKKMAGQLGNKRCTVQNQEVVRIDKERNILLVKGVVPGAPGSNVIVKHAVKAQGQKGE